MSDTEQVRKTVIGESSAIRVGLVLFLAGYVGTTSWFLSGLNSKVDMLIDLQKTGLNDGSALKLRVETLEKSNELFTQVGSPALRVRVDAIEKSVESLKKDFEFYKATAK